MGVRSRIAKVIAGTEIEKAPNLPAGAVTMNEQQMRNAVPGAIGQSYGTVNPLPRNPLLAGVPFGPGIPITPGAINPVNPATGRPGPAPRPPRSGDKKQARQRINVEVRSNRRRHPNALSCVDCGHVHSAGERRHEYDHYLGYDAEHHFDVEPVCTKCHAARAIARGERRSRHG